ncbi:hypothetical protein F4775DRAFT_512585 [Biscogniauxia sp. FL1348]|nr:hypothetical protein F4775DRAFT_512585 [Biscogniauxia sp. FL1348]
MPALSVPSSYFLSLSFFRTTSARPSRVRLAANVPSVCRQNVSRIGCSEATSDYIFAYGLEKMTSFAHLQSGWLPFFLIFLFFLSSWGWLFVLVLNSKYYVRSLSPPVPEREALPDRALVCAPSRQLSLPPCSSCVYNYIKYLVSPWVQRFPLPIKLACISRQLS